MNIIQKQHNESLNLNNKNLQKSKIMILSKEDEELFNFIKNYNISKANRDLSLIQSSKKNKHGEYKAKLLNQIGSISNKILSEKTQDEKKQEKLINDLLYRNDFNYNLEKKREKYNRLDKSQRLLRRNFLPKLSPQNTSNQLNKSKKDIILYSRINTDENYGKDKISFFNLINSDKNNRNYYLLVGNNKNSKKQQLPPVNKFMWNYHKLKLDKNNAIDYTDQKHEEMMKLYKDLEYKKKHRFVI